MADTSAIREIFVTGLKNAHAMENQALSIMKPQVSRIENYPEVAARLEQHVRETEGQMTRIDHLLQQLDESHSSIKDMAAFEHFEIASYKSLLTLAELGGFSFATSALQTNLKEEEQMAQWIDENLRTVTLRFASLREAGETAKI